MLELGDNYCLDGDVWGLMIKVGVGIVGMVGLGHGLEVFLEV